MRVIGTGGSHRLDITDLDRVGLFADTAGLLAAEGHTVRTAILRTVDDVAVNEWHVESPSGAVPDPARIERGLARLGRGDRAPLVTLDRRRAHVSRPSGQASIGTPGQARALVVPGASSDATVLEVRAQDRPGLLHELGAALAGAGVSVRSAHIATYAGQTLDTFYLTGADGLRSRRHGWRRRSASSSTRATASSPDPRPNFPARCRNLHLHPPTVPVAR